MELEFSLQSAHFDANYYGRFKPYYFDVLNYENIRCKEPIYFSHMLLPCPFFFNHVSDLDMVASYAMLPLFIIC